MEYFNKAVNKIITEEEALQAVKTLILWAGDDPNRLGMQETPKRVLKAYRKIFAGYEGEYADILAKAVEDMPDYSGMVVLKDIPFYSVCEHHLLPIEGTVDFCYLPEKKVIGIGRMTRLISLFARRFQCQERMTQEIANAFSELVEPQGVGVIAKARHHCMIALQQSLQHTLVKTECYIGTLQQADKKQQMMNMLGL